MSAAKFTPGPWEAVEHTAKSFPLLVGIHCRVVKQGGYTERDTICELIAQGESSYEPDITSGNARLIAASPELLEALAEIVAMDDGDERFAWKHEALFDKARAAITKATGVSQ